ncbi:hypothetical protein TELCIR_01333 [Teladorsagia circumcincta]|uniref:Uncharacterized protein n=1 Tax=Teladorsagia circumcincta TaxID=45464 RepID=A0A2G9V264_TELCI|nr:hypothetical protein TELCIR_01333 [Teladorsagia circumcincta]
MCTMKTRQNESVIAVLRNALPVNIGLRHELELTPESYNWLDGWCSLQDLGYKFYQQKEVLVICCVFWTSMCTLLNSERVMAKRSWTTCSRMNTPSRIRSSSVYTGIQAVGVVVAGKVATGRCSLKEMRTESFWAYKLSTFSESTISDGFVPASVLPGLRYTIEFLCI